MAIASSDAKIAFTSQLYDLENKANSGGISPDAGYTQAGSAIVDLKQYDSWSGSFLGPALGGWESWGNLLSRFIVVQQKFLAKMQSAPNQVSKPKADEIVNLTPKPQVMTAATCETNPDQAAIDNLGPFWGRFPGAKIYTCHQEKVILVGTVLGGLILLALLSPYANLLSKIIPRKRKRK